MEQLEQKGSTTLKWATRLLVVILTIVVILVVVLYWENTKMQVDRDFERMFPELMIALSWLI